jgi:hypothetical protein
MARKKKPDDEKKALDKQVATQMITNGIMNHLQARAVFRVAELVQGSTFVALKPYRKAKQTPAYAVAATLVASFLVRRRLQSTVQCVSIETPGMLPQRQDEALVASYLSLAAPGVQLTEFVREWTENGEQWVDENRQVTLKLVSDRMATLVRAPARRLWKQKDDSDQIEDWQG